MRRSLRRKRRAVWLWKGKGKEKGRGKADGSMRMEGGGRLVLGQLFPDEGGGRGKCLARGIPRHLQRVQPGQGPIQGQMAVWPEGR